MSQLSVRRWTPKHVAKWLKEEGFCDYVDLLCNKHRLDGISLLALSEYDLRSPPLELKVLGDIKRLMVSIRKLQKQNIDVLEELGLPYDGQSPTCSGGTLDWLCNGDPSRDCDSTDTAPVGEEYHQYTNGKFKQNMRRLDPEYWKTVLSSVYVVFVFGFTSFVMVIVHERVPDMRTYPPLPDIFLDSMPRIPWAFAMAEACGVILCNIWLLVLLLHKHRSILLRRMCSLMGTVFMLRCVTMFVTSLSVPGQHLQCSRKMYGDMWAKLQRAVAIWSGFGMTLTGVHTCGDYMFSGHTVVLTMLNFFVTEYTPRSWNFIHTLSWVLNLFGIFFILAAHEHYSIDVFIAFYITTRLFLYYHTLANTRAYQQSRRARIWFPMFSFFECNVNGPVPNEYCWPFSRPKVHVGNMEPYPVKWTIPVFSCYLSNSLITARTRTGITDTMAVPPAYADLGKSANDIFNKGYGFGMIKLDVKTKSSNGVEFKTSGISNTDTSKVTGILETNYKWAEYGLTLTEKWTTENTLGTGICVEDKITKGLKLTFDTTFSPNTGKKSGKLKAAYKREHVNVGLDVDLDFAGPTINGTAVAGYEGWLGGYQMIIDSAKSRVTQTNFAVGYKTGDFQLHASVNNGTDFGGSIYQKVNDNLETAVNLAWAAGSNGTRFGIAAKYLLDPSASISAKVNNASLVGIGYSQTLRPGMKLTLSALVDGKNINAGGHKLGLGLELEA
ncbi:sphingomyelin synthase-related protein 1-like [Pholidichthys leucotaenia]